MPSFGKKSIDVRATLHPLLKELCDRVVSFYNISLLVGHRNEAHQNQAYADGVSKKQWPDSKHNRFPSMAVDATPYPIPEDWGDLNGQTLHARDLNWKERVKFYEMTIVFEFAWQQMINDRPKLRNRYKLRSGKDWDGDNDYRDQGFDDLPHIELIELKEAHNG